MNVANLATVNVEHFNKMAAAFAVLRITAEHRRYHHRLRFFVDHEKVLNRHCRDTKAPCVSSV